MGSSSQLNLRPEVTQMIAVLLVFVRLGVLMNASKATHQLPNRALFGHFFPNFDLVDVVHILEINGKSGVLTVSGDSGSAYIQLTDGHPTTAKLGSFEAEEALLAVMRLEKGEFRFEEGALRNDLGRALPAELSVEALQLTAAVQRDEAARVAAYLPDPQARLRPLPELWSTVQTKLPPLPIRDVYTRIAHHPDESLSELLKRASAPADLVKAAVSWLVEKGVVESSIDTSEEPAPLGLGDGSTTRAVPPRTDGTNIEQGSIRPESLRRKRRWGIALSGLALVLSVLAVLQFRGKDSPIDGGENRSASTVTRQQTGLEGPDLVGLSRQDAAEAIPPTNLASSAIPAEIEAVAPDTARDDSKRESSGQDRSSQGDSARSAPRPTSSQVATPGRTPDRPPRRQVEASASGGALRELATLDETTAGSATGSGSSGPSASIGTEGGVVNHVEAPAGPAQAAPVGEQEDPVFRPSRTRVSIGDLVKLGPDVIAPILSEQPILKYPKRARRVNKSVVVKVGVLVDETGQVIESKLLSETAGFGLDAAALEAANGATYSPALKQGVPVKVWTTITFAFRVR